jgi:hypothetical protein
LQERLVWEYLRFAVQLKLSNMTFPQLEPGKNTTSFFTQSKPPPRAPLKAGSKWEKEKGKKQMKPVRLDQAKPNFWAKIFTLMQ